MMAKPVYTAMGITLLDAVGIGLLIPVLPFAVLQLGGSPFHVTMLVATYSLAGFLLSSPAGRLSDKLGRKLAICACLAIAVVGYLGLVFAGSLFALYVFRFITGTSTAKHGVMNAYVIDLVDERDRTQYIGLMASMTSIGALLGPLFGGWLSQVTEQPIDALAFVSGMGGAVTVAALLIAILLLPTSRAEPIQQKTADREGTVLKLLRPFVTLQFGLFFAFGTIFSGTALLVNHRFGWEITETGILISAITGAILIMRMYGVNKISNWFGVESATYCSGLALAALFLIFGMATHPVAFAVAYLFAGAAYAACAVLVTVWASRGLTEAQRGFGMGRLNSTSSLGLIVSAVLSGALFSVAAYVPFVFAAAILLACVCVFRMSVGEVVGVKETVGE